MAFINVSTRTSVSQSASVDVRAFDYIISLLEVLRNSERHAGRSYGPNDGFISITFTEC